MPLSRRRLLVSLAAAAAAPRAAAAFAAPRQPAGESMKSRVEALARPMVEQGQTVGIAVGVLDAQGQAHFFNVGRLAKGEDRTPDADSLFELGSVTKCFTGILLADFVQRREVRLEEAALKFLPRGARLPEDSGRPITLEELATYSSGLPRMPSNFGRTPAERARYSPEKMLEFLGELARKEGGRSPRRHYLYSNLGFALLGHCLAERAQEPIRPLLLSRLCRRLGMESTCFEPSARQQPRVAKTYDASGKPVPPWETGCIAPAGMLRSSARDMVRFLAANVGRHESELSGAIKLSHQARYETGVSAESKANHKIGLAWFIEPASGILHHDGATSGSSSNLLFDPKSKVGVVVLMNRAKAPVMRLSQQVMKLFNASFDADAFPAPPRNAEEGDG